MGLGGAMRIAMPNSDYLIERYLDDWRDQDWLKKPEYRHIDAEF